MAYCITGYFWYAILQLHTGSWVRTSFLGSFRPLLDLLGIFPSAHYGYNPVLADMATLELPAYGLILGDARSRSWVALRCHRLAGNR
jgi:hypothetical protein